jgi:hypothetical protein
MPFRLSLRRYALFLFVVCVLAVGWNMDGAAQSESAALPKTAAIANERPHYNIRLNLDYRLLTFSAHGAVKVPVTRGDSLSDVVFFIYANAPGVAGNDASHSNVVVDEVKLGDALLEYSQRGAVVRVKLPAPQTSQFTLNLKWRGVVPRAPAGSGGLMDAMGGMDLSSIFGGGAQTKKDVDYGVYSYGNGVLSLGSFWYPSLAVRQNGKWMDEAPGGVGDVGFAEASDFHVSVAGVEKEMIVFPTRSGFDGVFEKNAPGEHRFFAAGLRDFPLLVSDQFVHRQRKAQVGSHEITVSVYVTKKHEAKADEVLEIAANALQIYSKRFGAYRYVDFKVVEGPMRGGAGGMEFSGVVSIASFLFDDMDKQMQELGASLGVGDIEKTMAQLFPENAAENGAGALQNENANPATEMLGGLLGGQKAILDSLLEQTIAHETAHQWWAMAVGSDAQRAPWVDESLTNYSAVVYFEDRYGKEKAEQMMELHLKGTYSTGRMLGGADAPVNLGSADYINNLQYGAVVYGKGALFYDALRKLVGDENFFAALRTYYKKYNGQIAPARGLLEIVKVQAPDKANAIENLFRRWIEETHGDEDIAGGKIGGVQDLLGGLLGGMMGGMEQ